MLAALYHKILIFICKIKAKTTASLAFRKNLTSYKQHKASLLFYYSIF